MSEPVQFTQEMLFIGAHEIRQSGFIKEEVDSQAVITLAARVYRAMRAAEPKVMKLTEIVKGTI